MANEGGQVAEPPTYSRYIRIPQRLKDLGFRPLAPTYNHGPSRYRGRQNLRNVPHAERPAISKVIDFAVKAGEDTSVSSFTGEEIILLQNLKNHFTNLDWAKVQETDSKRHLENILIHVLEETLLLPELDTSIDLNIKLPGDLAPYFSKPKPIFILYGPLHETIYGGTASRPELPLFTMGIQGGPAGTTIDCALPQDTCTTYTMAHAWAVFGMPAEEVAILSAGTEGGLVTQFFLTYFSDVKDVKDDPYPFRAPTLPSPQYRHLITLPISKKLDPSDPDDLDIFARMLGGVRRYVHSRYRWFLNAQAKRVLWRMRGPPEPQGDDDDDDDDGNWDAGEGRSYEYVPTDDYVVPPTLEEDYYSTMYPSSSLAS
ncbi:hypothetical protein HK104_010176 [Borealophlyctis nickersoniae]|nr:hypothetical protein HK104_010176 [Borealophlyctis nickersoniae]